MDFATAAPYRLIVANIPVDALGDIWVAEDGVFGIMWTNHRTNGPQSQVRVNHCRLH